MTVTAPKKLSSGLPAYQEARREKIIDAARKLLEKNDFDQIQIRDVAATAGVALGTLYRYFNSKEHLYAAVLLKWATPFTTNDKSWASLSDVGRLTKRIDRAMDAFDRRPQFFKVSLMIQQSTDPNAQELAEMHATILNQAIIEDLSGLDESESNDVAHIIWGTLMQMFMRVDNDSATLADTRRTMTTLIDMVRSRYGENGAEENEVADDGDND